MTLPQSTDRINSILQSYSASHWIKGAVLALVDRDPLDAVRDAELLAAIFKQRYQEITGVKP